VDRHVDWGLLFEGEYERGADRVGRVEQCRDDGRWDIELRVLVEPGHIDQLEHELATGVDSDGGQQ
jgi:hypothetical protein